MTGKNLLIRKMLFFRLQSILTISSFIAVFEGEKPRWYQGLSNEQVGCL